MNNNIHSFYHERNRHLTNQSIFVFFSSFPSTDDSYPTTIKEEPQTVPNSPPMSPIDMETQEKIKLERKRQRNRVAASKCRKRKLERISKLEDKVKLLKSDNTELGSIIKTLKEHVCQLKQQVIDHISKGCNIPSYNVPFQQRNEWPWYQMRKRRKKQNWNCKIAISLHAKCIHLKF